MFFQTVFVYFISELGSRRIMHCGVTRNPSDVWVTQQIRDATPFEEGPRFLIRDNDSKYGERFSGVAGSRGINVLRTPIRAPKANTIGERFIGSVRRECLDHMLIINERHLRHTVNEFVDYYNHARPHQGIEQRIPTANEAVENRARESDGRIVGRSVLGGLHHDYQRVA